MLIIKTNQPNTLVVTVSQNSELSNPEYLFSFTHIFSKQKVNFIPTDISTHKSRYDEFYFVEGTNPGEIRFPYEGLYLYSISEQPAGSGNLDPALATNVVENGEAQIIVQSAITMDSQYDIYISSNENNSNIIFAPDEPNPSPYPTPSITPSPTSTPVPPSQTPTPSITPTLTPTPSSTPIPTNINPSTLNALWWMDYQEPSRFILSSGNAVQYGIEKINNVVFEQLTSGWGPIYYNTALAGVPYYVQDNVAPLANVYGTYLNSFTDFTWFGYLYDDASAQFGGKVIRIRTLGLVDEFLLSNPNNISPYWNVYVKGLTNNINLPFDFSNYSQWTAIGIRVYQDNTFYRIEIWQNGILTDTTLNVGTLTTKTDVEFGMMYDGGIDYNAEQFLFDRKLTDGEMGQMFNYLSNKY